MQEIGFGCGAAVNEGNGHKKTVSESETVAGQQLRKNNGNTRRKIGKTDGDEDLTVYSRFPTE